MSARRAKRPSPGDHLAVSRGLYTHHGILVGERSVIHLDGEPFDGENSAVRRASLARFAKGGEVWVVRHRSMLGREETLRRAESRLGERGYDLVFGNCEHFATWCRTGVARSAQVELAVRALVSPIYGDLLLGGDPLERALEILAPPPVRILRALMR